MGCFHFIFAQNKFIIFSTLGLLALLLLRPQYSTRRRLRTLSFPALWSLPSPYQRNKPSEASSDVLFQYTVEHRGQATPYYAHPDSIVPWKFVPIHTKLRGPVRSSPVTFTHQYYWAAWKGRQLHLVCGLNRRISYATPSLPILSLEQIMPNRHADLLPWLSTTLCCSGKRSMVRYNPDQMAVQLTPWTTIRLFLEIQVNSDWAKSG